MTEESQNTTDRHCATCCTGNCNQGRDCCDTGHVLGGSWWTPIAIVGVVMFVGWVLAPAVANLLIGWRTV